MIANELRELVVGDVVGDTQRTVLLCHKLQDRVPGDCYATWIAVAHKPGEFHPYVVWNVVARPTGFHAEYGTYCSTVTEAIGHYESRGGR